MTRAILFLVVLWGLHWAYDRFKQRWLACECWYCHAVRLVTLAVTWAVTFVVIYWVIVEGGQP